MIRYVVPDRQHKFQGLPAGLAAPLSPESQPRSVGPVAVLAHILPFEVAPGALPVDFDVRPHPHVGLAALTYIYEGHVTHRDSLGSHREIGPGAIAVTYAGRGVVHSERFERLRLHGGRYEQLQILLALPDDAEDMAPSFLFVPPDEAPTERAEGAVVRRLADTARDRVIPFPTDLFLHDVRLERGGRYQVPDDFGERAVYVLQGSVTAAGTEVTAQETAVLEPTRAVFEAAEPARLFAFGGAPIGPRYVWWNYMHSSLDRLEAAKAAWRRGEVALPPGDTESFSPAPPDDGRPLMRLNFPASP